MIETTHQANASQSYTLASRSKSRHTNQNLPKSTPTPTIAYRRPLAATISATIRFDNNLNFSYYASK